MKSQIKNGNIIIIMLKIPTRIGIVILSNNVRLSFFSITVSVFSSVTSSVNAFVTLSVTVSVTFSVTVSYSVISSVPVAV